MRVPYIGAVMLPVLLAATAFAQTQVNITTQVFPPYSPYLSDYVDQPNRVLVQLTTSARQSLQVRLLVKIHSEDGNIRITSDSGYRPLSPITLNPAAPTVVRADQLKEYFEVGHLTFEGISETEIVRGNGLPEGNYEICIRALDYATGAPLSGAEPAGCSPPFRIQQAEPPEITQPANGSAVTATDPQNLVMTWTHPVGAPYSVEYLLKMVEIVPDSRDPNDAMNSATTPAFFEQTVSNVTSFTYGPAQSPLEKGRRYALQVTVRDPSNRTTFRNDGKSEVIAFTYGAGYQPSSVMPLPKANPATPRHNPLPSPVSGPRFPFPNNIPLTTSISGQLVYAFPGGNPQPPQGGAGQRHLKYNQPGWNLPPLPFVTVKLIRFYYVQDKSGNRTSDFQYGDIPGNHEVLSVTTTDANGDFSFVFENTDSMGEIAAETTLNFGALEFSSSYTGSLHRVYRVMVDEPHYTSPENDIVVQPWGSVNTGPLAANVRTYNLTVTTIPDNWNPEGQKAVNYVPFTKIYILRAVRPEHVPADEGNPPNPPQWHYGMAVVNVGSADQYGRFTFTNLVKNVGPNDMYYLYAETPGNSDFNYVAGVNSYQFDYSGQGTLHAGSDVATWNSQYQVPNPTASELMHPLQPEVTGEVYVNNTTEPLPWAAVELQKYAVFFWPDEKVTLTDQNGGFGFSNLDVIIDAKGVIQPMREVHVSIAGFQDTTVAVNGGVPLRYGERANLPRIYLNPASNVHGTVVDEAGHGVDAAVYFSWGIELNAVSSFYAKYPLFYWTPAAFSGAVPSGNQQVIVVPNDNSYFAETLNVSVPKGNYDLGQITVHEKLHRLWVMTSIAGGSPMIPHPLANARVEVENVSPVLVTDGNGNAYYKWASAGDLFNIKVQGPDGQDWTPQVVAAQIPPSKQNQLVTVALKRATRIAGYVHAGQSGVAGARVFLDQSSALPIETFTDPQGNYVLHDVPIEKPALTFRAVKQSSDYIGDARVKVVSPLGTDTVNFQLTVYKDMDITQLLKFPIEVESLAQSGSDVYITGAISSLPGNPQFGVDTVVDPQLRLRFHGLAIVPDPTHKNSSGVPLALPKTLPVTTDHQSFGLRVYSSYYGRQEGGPNAGITVDTVNAAGATAGRVSVDAGSFKLMGNAAFPGGRIYLKRPDVAGPSLLVPAISATGTSPVNAPDGMLVTDAGGNALTYSLYDYPASADPAKSRLTSDTMRLYTTLHAGIKHMGSPTESIEVGDIRFHPSGIDLKHGTQPLSIPMEKWSLASSDWTLGTNGLVLNGTLRTGLVNVPFTALRVDAHDSLVHCTDFQLSSMNLADVVPLQVNGTSTLGYDPGHGHWELSVFSQGPNQPAATISGLPGMGASDHVDFYNFYLMSSDSIYFVPLGTPITLYQLVTMTPINVRAAAQGVNISGALDLHIPSLVYPTGGIYYSKVNGQVVASWQNIPMYADVNGVHLSFTGSQNLDANGLWAQGVVSEAGKFSFNMRLHRTLDSTWITVDPGQQLAIAADNSNRLTGISGGMRVTGPAWSDFGFAGDFTGAKGASGRLAFTVTGDVVASGQAISLKNINTPFGDVSLAYDFNLHQLTGHLHFDQTMPGGTRMWGDASILVDAGGWYFVSGGNLHLPDPGMDGTAALVFGDYQMTPDIVTIFQNNSWVYSLEGHLPPTFPAKVSGFYFEGRLAIPIIIPSVDFDFGVVSGHLTLQAGGDMRFGMSFDQQATTFSIGQDVYIHIGVGLGASVVVLCAGVDADLIEDVGFDGQYQTNGNWFIDGTATLRISGDTYIGGGICNSSCDNVGCVKTEASASVTVGVHAHYGTDGKKLEFYFM